MIQDTGRDAWSCWLYCSNSLQNRDSSHVERDRQWPRTVLKVSAHVLVHTKTCEDIKKKGYSQKLLHSPNKAELFCSVHQQAHNSPYKTSTGLFLSFCKVQVGSLDTPCKRIPKSSTHLLPQGTTVPKQVQTQSSGLPRDENDIVAAVAPLLA